MGNLSKFLGTNTSDISKIFGLNIGNITSLLGHSLAVPWDEWDESSEQSLATSNIYCCFFENPTTGGNETGVGGGISGNGLILTQSGNVPGAVNGYRSLNGTDQFFYATQSIMNLFVNQSYWTLILKIKDFVTNASDSQYLISFKDSAVPPTERFFVAKGGDDKIYSYIHGIGDTQEILYMDNTAPTSGAFYVAVWNDNGTVRCGFTTTRPTKLSDFPSGNYVTQNYFDGQYEYLNGSSNIGAHGDGAYYPSDLDLGYIVCAKECLIDNSS